MAHTSVPALRAGSVLRRPMVPALAVVLILIGASAAAADGRLQIFQTQKIAPVSFTTGDLVALPDLRAYGELAFTAEPDIRRVADAAAAARETGIDVPMTATLPRGVTGRPEYQVGGQARATFTFSADRARRAAADAGRRLPPPPAGLDGTKIELVAGPGVAQIWSQPSGLPSLVVGRAFAPSASSSGAAFEAVRDYLLSLPGVPDNLASQLRAFTGDGSTLPLPVPANQFTTTEAAVNGVPATVLAARDRTMAGVVWVNDGVVTVVAGALGSDEVLSIARDLR